MDIVDFIKNGATINNPQYKKGSKKGLAAIPYIKTNDIKQVVDPTDKMANVIANNSYGLTHLQNNKNKYEKYDVFINPINTEEQLRRERAQNQSNMEKTANSLAQIGLNEVLIGTVLGFSDLVDAGINGLGLSKDNDFSNPISDYLAEVQDSMREKLEIYRQDPNKSWQVGDFGWWADNFVNVGSTLSLMVPAKAGTSLIGKAAKLAKLDKGALWLTKTVANAGNRVQKGKQLLYRPRAAYEKMSNLAEAGGMAFISRTAEDYQEARETKKTVYQERLNDLNNMSAEARQKFIKDNPEYVNLSNEEIANDIAGKAAQNTFKYDYAMLLMDAMQYNSINKILKNSLKGTTSAAARITQRNLMRTLAGESAEALEDTGKKAIFSEWAKYTISHPMDIIRSIPFSEGVEEAYQGTVQARSEELSKKLLDDKYNFKALSSYITDPEIWEQAFWGVVGGAVFGGAANLYGRAKELYTVNKENKNVTKEGQREALTQSKLKTNEINNRINRINTFIERINQVDDGYSSTGDDLQDFVHDSNGKLVYENDTPIRRQLTEEEQALQKDKLITDFVTDLTMDAIDVGNQDLLREMIESDIFKKYITDKANNYNQFDEEVSRRVKDAFDRAEEYYLTAIDTIYNNVDSAQAFPIRAVARAITRNRLYIDGVQEDLNEVIETLNSLDSYKNAGYAYEDRYRLIAAKALLDKYDNAEKLYAEALSNKKISKYAYEQYIEDLNERRADAIKLLNEASDNIESIAAVKKAFKEAINSFNENTTASEKHIKYKQLIEKVKDSYIDEYSVISQIGAASSNAKKLIVKKVALELAIDNTNSGIPTTKKEYQRYYEEVAGGLDKYISDRYINATNKITDYLTKSEDIDSAYESLFTEENLSDDVKEAVQILKLGHYSTSNYKKIIDAIKAFAQKAVQKEQDEANTVEGGNVQQGVNPEAAAQINEEADKIIEEGEKVEEKQNEFARRVNELMKQGISEEEAVAILTQQQEAFEQRQENLIDSEDDEIDPNRKGLSDTQKEQLKIQDRIDKLVAELTLNGDNDFKELANKIINIDSADKSDKNFVEVLNYFLKNIKNKLQLDEYKDIAYLLNNDAKLESLVMDRVRSILSAFASEKGLPVSQAVKTRLRKVIAQVVNGISVEVKDGEFVFHSKTSGFNDVNLMNEYISQLFDAYIEQAKLIEVNGKYYINFDNLFEFLLKQDNLRKEDIITLFNRFIEYFDNNKINNKYQLSNLQQLNIYKDNIIDYIDYINMSRAEREKVDNYMHINEPTLRTRHTKYTEAIKALQDGKVKPYARITGNSISIYVNFENEKVEVGYLGTVEATSDNNTLKLKNQDVGFMYEITRNLDGYSSNFDILFNPIIQAIVDKENASQDAINLLEAIVKFKLVNNEQIFNPKEFLDLVYKVVDKDTLLAQIGKRSKYRYIASKKAYDESKIDEDILSRTIAKSISDVLSYKNADFKGDTLQFSYDSWKERIYTNYMNTLKIEDTIENDNGIIEVNLANIGVPELNINKDRTYNIADNTNQGFKKENNPIIAVSSHAGDIITEDPNVKVDGISTFSAGSMGFYIGEYNGVPIMAPFVEANPIMNSQFAGQLRLEIINLVKSFIAKDADGNYARNFNKTRQAFRDIFGISKGNESDFYSSPLTYGLEVVSTGTTIMIVDKNNLKDGKHIPKLTLYSRKDKNGKEIRGWYLMNDNGIPYSKGENEEEINNMYNKIANDLINKVVFAKSFFMFKNSDKLNTDDNEHFFKRDGKLIVKVNGTEFEYDSYFDFVMQNKAFNTNAYMSRGSYLHKKNDSNDLYLDINTAFYKSTSDRYTGKGSIESATSIIQQATMKKPVEVTRILKALGIDGYLFESLTNTSPVEEFDDFLPKYIYYTEAKDKQKEDAGYDPKTGKIYITQKGIRSALENRDMLRLILHESLHKRMNELSSFKEFKATEDLLDTYNQFIQVVESEASKGDKEAIKIKDWIKNNNFYPDNKFIKNDKNNRIFAEEWLVEAITRPELAKFLNEHTYNGKINEGKKSLLQRLFDIILNLFGIENANKNSILAKQYSIFYENINDTELTPPIAREAIGEEGLGSEEQGQEPAQEPVVPDNPKDDEDYDEDYDDEDNESQSPNDVDLDDDLYSSTSSIDTDNISNIEDEAIRLNKDNSQNVNGKISMNSVNDLITQFPIEIQPLIADSMTNGDIEYLCTI